ncbi:phage terminase large subunit [uncultured Ilyobacter sp.]|uniref:phage terminase large subunit n=1 Tax=uncultured Ilyobacter sp. TaxID=544433 RepID=UPI0029C00901|nr:phage terminase large subunit [uncultured Ilyobacter sp.]
MEELNKFTPIQIKAAAELEIRKRRRKRMRESLEDFLLEDGRGNWKSAKHLRYLINRLEKFVEEVKEGKSPRLIVCMPPRHGKSEVSTKKFPAWVLGNNPDWEIIAASYSADLAEKFSRICRDTFKEHESVFGVEVSKDSSSVKEWGIEGQRGAFAATGVGGSATGKGAHVAIIDDPFKNREDAQSTIKRERVWDWYKSTIRTRLAPGGGIIVIQTRWHEEDLAGMLIKAMDEGEGEEFELVNFPAVAEEDDILGREPGDPLWPERFPKDELLKTKQAVGRLEWDSLYQQKPTVDGGEIMRRKDFRYFRMKDGYMEVETDEGTRTVFSKDCLRFQTIDTALKTGKKNDFTAIATWDVDKMSNLYLVDLYMEKIEVPDQWRIIKGLRSRWNVMFQACEDKQSGTGLIQQAKREAAPLKVLKADTDKVTRSIPFSIMLENKKVFFNMNMAKISQLEDQLTKFPNGAHDDAVDVCSYAAILVQKGRYGGGRGIAVSAPIIAM